VDGAPPLEDVQPILVGAAAELRRRTPRGSMGSLFRGHRSGDTGELEAITADIPGDVPFAISTDPVDPEAARYAPRPPARLAWLRPILVLAVVVGILWIGAAAAWSWSQKQYYVGEDNGIVVIFRGVNADLPGLSLSQPFETTDVQLSRLSEFDAGKVRQGIDAGDLADAHATVENLAAKQTAAGAAP
jgi:protein phosphatase